MIYTPDELAIIWLDSFDKISYKKKCYILELTNTFRRLMSNFRSYRYDLLLHMTMEVYCQLEDSLSSDYMVRLLDKLEKNGVSAITYINDNYPEKLRLIDAMPLVLYAKGNISLLNTKGIAVVGSRAPTRYGVNLTRDFTYDLSIKGLTIISGLARGIDTIAHKACLEAKGKTIAVIGSGLNIIYPAENTNLLKEIIDNDGLVVSEYTLDTPPLSYHFPLRNRIISGISEGVLVAEAGMKSGSLITVDYAVEQGREVFLVPGNINSKMSHGTNDRIKLLQGAMVTEVNDIFKTFNMDTRIELSGDNIQLDFISEMIMSKLEKNGKTHFEELLELTGIDVSTLNTVLLTLQISGLIDKLPSNYYEIN